MNPLLNRVEYITQMSYQKTSDVKRKYLNGKKARYFERRNASV